MILGPFDLAKTGELARVSVAGWSNARVRVRTAGGVAGEIEIKEAFGTSRPESFTTPIKPAMGGATITDIDVMDTADIAVFNNTQDAGALAWIEVQPYGVVWGRLSYAQIRMDAEGHRLDFSTAFENQETRRLTILVEPKIANTATAEFWDKLESGSHPIKIENAEVDGTPQTMEWFGTSTLSIKNTTPQAGQVWGVWIYQTGGYEGAAQVNPNTAYTDRSNYFEGAQGFESSVVIGDITDGVTSITTESTANNVATFPDESGEIALVATPTPSDNEMLIRSGDGYVSVPVAGTEFPTPLFDGQVFKRTDVAGGHRFEWDATRSKWLGELQIVTASRATAASSGSLDLRTSGGVEFSAARGYSFVYPMTIVGIDFWSAADFTADIDWIEGTTKIATVYSATTRNGSDYTLNQDIDGDANYPHKYPKVQNITAGSCNNPIFRFHMRINGTAL